VRREGQNGDFCRELATGRRRHAPSEDAGEEDGHDRLDALRPREAGDLDTWSGGRLDRGPQWDDEILELVLGYRLDHRLERKPGGLNDGVVPVGKGRDELPDPRYSEKSSSVTSQKVWLRAGKEAREILGQRDEQPE
jgi:hypothetical protein